MKRKGDNESEKNSILQSNESLYCLKISQNVSFEVKMVRCRLF